MMNRQDDVEDVDDFIGRFKPVVVLEALKEDSIASGSYLCCKKRTSLLRCPVLGKCC